MPENSFAEISWRDEVTPLSNRFDDPYFNLANGLEETRHVFLSGNDLADRLQNDLHIAELGFGTGLNLIALWLEWRRVGGGKLRFTSFEAFPMNPEDMARALSAFPEAFEAAGPLLAAREAGLDTFDMAGIEVELIIGDARETLPRWGGKANAWFLDGFSPAKNPELWDADLLQAVADHTAPGGTAATYTAAGFVRRNLQAAGFDVTRAPGYGRKRHMTRARLTAA
ncbi:MAG: FAD-dependent oxidoreductase [Rhodobacterales bacterium]|nr:MAG: FAD-dependent oxidoreductase [Rhodobacterales bacterium]